MSLLSSTITAVSNHLKPHRAEALQRIRLNALCLVTTLIVSYLLPVPSLLTAARILLTSSHHQRWSTEWIYEWTCVFEMAIITMFAYNILEAIYALKYPRAPLPQITSPASAKLRSGVAFSPTQKRPFKVLSPNSSPQPQKSFTFSPSSSLTSASISFSQSSTNPLYPQSPISTPSRVVHYSVPPSSLTKTMGSSTSTSEYLATPSPVSAYRGRLPADVGRALDGFYLTRLMSDDTSFDD
ncbi:hypothetical protein BYT27DRAFT_7195502 [Phlegmacium glaucopus]|nr:hypothetical protein BYT27DRAFT_7195502 [Phlegmacium glaucopus]